MGILNNPFIKVIIALVVLYICLPAIMEILLNFGAFLVGFLLLSFLLKATSRR